MTVTVNRSHGEALIERAGVRRDCERLWVNSDDSDRRSGRGWAALEEDGSLCGRIYFHLGDDSSFRAERIADNPRA
ncbi:MAG: hypothetical protein WD404_00645 [Solirubrobacterales bacterium]